MTGGPSHCLSRSVGLESYWRRGDLIATNFATVNPLWQTSRGHSPDQRSGGEDTAATAEVFRLAAETDRLAAGAPRNQESGFERFGTLFVQEWNVLGRDDSRDSRTITLATP